MTAQDITIVALQKMGELETLLAAKRQANWQKFKSAGENKALWWRVIDIQKARIKSLEGEIKTLLRLAEYKARRSETK